MTEIGNTTENETGDMALAAELDGAHAAVTAAQRRLLDVVRDCDAKEIWRADGGCRDLAQWVSARLGITNWHARRWVNAARALPELPHLSAALDGGVLCLDKVVELARFATAETEAELVDWAAR